MAKREDISLGEITFRKLKTVSGAVLSHIAIAAGKSDVETDADVTVTITVSGLLAATDFAQAQLIAAANDVYVEKTVVTDNTVTVTLSGIGGAGTQVSYVVYRPAT